MCVCAGGLNLFYGIPTLNLCLRKCNVFTVCTEQMWSPYTEHAASGLHNPTRLKVEVRFVQAQYMYQQDTTRSPR